MKLQLSATGVLAVVGLAVGGYVAWRVFRGAGELAEGLGEKVAAVANAVSPFNQDNVFYSGVNELGDAIVSEDGPGSNADGSWTLGGWLFDVTHPGWVDDALGRTPAPVPSPSGAGSVFDQPGMPDYFGA